MMNSQSKAAEQVRESSRQIVRELGFLKNIYADTDTTHSECHALLELYQNGILEVLELGTKLKLDKSTTSRLVTKLKRRGWLKNKSGKEDLRKRPFALTESGKKKVLQINTLADAQVLSALKLLAPEEQAQVIQGFNLYAKALKRTKQQQGFKLRPVAPSDDAAVANLVKETMTEFGSSGEGFALHDKELESMSAAYGGARAEYLVVTKHNKVVGGAGFARLKGAKPHICELRKNYLFPEARGKGIGDKLLTECIKRAKAAGYKYCYLETSCRMVQAQGLYKKHGFTQLDQPLGNTGHFGCDMWFGREL
ncbi:bifunctional helix-turn-helix transcriptional regulator/GNAT family N-acetyltransferase [Oligoflexia bacterium]|nr:bifunctional helix-turn-helix transcriptional regulator/GNAT family N-acetyltransferase [Oligoflexia bacterium]